MSISRLRIMWSTLNHMTCSCEAKSMLIPRLLMKEFTVSSSFLEPDSNPQESWKMNRGLLLNMSSLSISCSPRCEKSKRECTWIGL